MTYRCFQNNKLINDIYENGKSISKIYSNGLLVWEKGNQNGIVTIYAKDGAVVLYKDNEIGREPLYYGDTSITDLDPMMTDIYANHLGVLSICILQEEPYTELSVLKPYIDNCHLSAFEYSMGSEMTANSLFLSVIANNTDISCIPPFGYIMCPDLKHIESNNVVAIGPMAFGVLGL